MGLVWLLALRNLIAHRTKSLVVGALMAFGTMLLVVGLALVDGIEEAMRASITDSVAGDFQLYDRDAKDELILLGSTFISVPDVGRIEHFEEVRAAVENVEGVRAVIPMGFDIGTIATPGELDRAIEMLKTSAGGEARAHARLTLLELLEELYQELQKQAEITSRPELVQTKLEVLSKYIRVSDEQGGLGPLPQVWSLLDSSPSSLFEQLETEVAPLGSGGEQLLFRFLGTDLERYTRVFDGFDIVKGAAVPKGQRGFLFSDKYFERRVKHRVAREFDNIVKALEEGSTIAETDAQKGRVKRMARQWRRITRQLDEAEARELEVDLKAYLGQPGTLPELLEVFLGVDDQNVHQRRAWFYEHVAPKIQLYRLQPGDELTVRAYTRSGFLRAVNVTFFGTFTFRGLESSDLAGIYNIIDLVSFRYLHGVMSESELAELKALRDEVGLQDLESTEALEEAMFGTDEPNFLDVDAPEALEIDRAEFGGAKERGLSVHIDPTALKTGMVLDAAVVVDPTADRSLMLKRVQSAVEEAELPVQVATWKQVSGLLGQFVIMVRIVLYVAVTVIFLVAIVIINNAMVMAMMERVKEVGTLRAIGAQKSMVLAIALTEILALGVVAGTVGALLGGGLVAYWGVYGLEAPNRELMFVFGGPELFPGLAFRHLGWGVFIILIVSLCSAIYPALLGASVSPIEAMSSEE